MPVLTIALLQRSSFVATNGVYQTSSVTRLGDILEFGYFLHEHFLYIFIKIYIFRTWFVQLILTFKSRWATLNLSFNILATVLATFPKKLGDFLYRMVTLKTSLLFFKPILLRFGKNDLHLLFTKLLKYVYTGVV